MEHKAKKRRWGVKILCVLLVLSSVIALAFSLTGRTSALAAKADDSNALKYRQYTAGNTIEDGVLFIGTWLIHKDGLNEQFYEQAMETASINGQNDMFYKSEFADGKWFNLALAGSLRDISLAGETVDESQLRELYVQYYVKADGTVIDIFNNSEVNPFNIVDPYDLKKLPEMLAYYAEKGCEVKALAEYQEVDAAE